VTEVPPRGDRAAPPRVLDPVLAAWEVFDRRRRRIRPIRAAGILGLEEARHRGRDVVLADGTVVRRGARLGEIHLLNARVRQLETRAGLAAAFRLARADVRALDAWAAGQPLDRRPVAYHAEGIMARFAARAGWEVRPRPLTPWQRVRNWYFRWLLVHWTPAGRERLRHGRGPLASVDAWLPAVRPGGDSGWRGDASRMRPAPPRGGADAT
jgi:hypothetical protein